MSKEKEDIQYEAKLDITTEVDYEADISPTDVTSLRRVAEGIPIAAWFILINEFCERFAFYGGSTPFQNYVQNGPMDDPAGALDRGQSTATALQNFFTFFCYFTPMLGAIVADQYIGRYWTIIIFSIVYMVGWLILTCTSITTALEHGAGFPGYVVALIVIGFGTGGIKGIVSPLCADQYRKTENYVKELPSGERVLVDYDLSIQHLYNWFYWAINVGSLLGGVICPLLELHVGFYAAFLLPTCIFAVAIAVFIGGSKLYYKPGPTESVIMKAFSVIGFARKQSNLPENKEAKKNCGDILDFAKRDSGLPAVSEWSAEKQEKAVWSDRFVDELKEAVMACKIFVPLSIYWVCYNQLSNNLISQAGVMARPSGLPNDIMNNFDPIALIIFIPITDSIIYPFLRRHKINFFPQQRITLGFFFGTIAMVYAAVVQHYIYMDPLFISSGGEASNVSVFIQIPCYVLIAFSEICASITSIEYAYTHAPKSMKSLVSALSLWPNCVSALISLAISPSSHDPNMVWVYTGVAVGAFVCGCIYYYLFRHYDYIDEEARMKRMTDQQNAAEKYEATVLVQDLPLSTKKKKKQNKMPKETALKQTRDEVSKKLNDGLTVVVLGASGDLAKKKTFPALFSLYADGFLPKTTEIVGYARSGLEEKEYHERITSFFEVEDDGLKKKKDEFLKICKYVQGQYDEDESFEKLDKYLTESEDRRGLKGDQRNRLFYVALPPGVYIKVSQGLDKFVRSKEASTLLVIEKPFGKDSESAIELVDEIKKLFKEEEVYRIDHYLGKELAKNIMNIRFSNMIFGPIWNRQYIDTVQITLKEPFGCEGRGGYFDEYGVIRDVIQNHLLQLFSLIAMERPIRHDAESVRDEKVKVLRCVKPVTLDDCLLGQYTKNGDKPSYTEDDTVEDGSLTATFAALVLKIQNERWDGVPFIIKNGKAMDNSKAEIRIQFKKVPGSLFEDSPRNELVFRVQPDEAIYMKFNNKVPGFSADSMITELDLTYKSRYDNLKIPAAYEILLLDALRGDHSNFVRDDELIAAWDIFTPLLHRIEGEKVKPEPYPYGSRGPEKLNEFVEKYGVERIEHENYQWPKQNLEG